MPSSDTSMRVLADALLRPDCYPDDVETVQRLETHISWVFLTGRYAYKLKKPVNLGFLDFSTLEARRRSCEDELRLNKRLAADLYLDTVEIRGSPKGPRIDGEGPLLDYAVRMRQFSQDALASSVLARGELKPELLRGLASRLAAFHAQLPSAPADSTYGTPESILHNAQENFGQIRAVLTREEDLESLRVVRDWTEREFLAVYGRLASRHTAGRIRECHGDLHLGNIVLLGGELVPFDCIEFSADFRWVDVMSEVAFVVMDLLDRGAPRHAWLFLNDYLEASGDYEGLALLRFYLVYRAMVRAKVHLTRAEQCSGDPHERRRLLAEYRSYVQLALRCTSTGRGALVLMHGLSGCGKSTVARELVQALGGIAVRSDVERKRLHGLEPLERSGSPPAGGLYAEDAGRSTYGRLALVAREIAAAGYTAIIDATCLRRSQRACMRETGEALGVPMMVVDVQAPVSALRARIAKRAAQASDASEATLQVLDQQIATAEPILEDEGFKVVSVDGAAPLSAAAISKVLRG